MAEPDYKKLFENERKRADDERKRADDERKRADDTEIEREAIKQQLAQVQARIDATTFHSFLSLCHHMLFLTLNTQSDPARSSAPGLTKVDDKLYPQRLLPWSQFPALHKEQYGRLEATFGDRKRFPSLISLDGIKDFMSEDPVADEQDMVQFQFLAVEGCTKKVFQTFLSVQTPPSSQEQPASPLQSSSSSNSSNSISQCALPRAVRFCNNPYGLLSADLDSGVDELDLPAYATAMKEACKLDAVSRGRPPADGPPPAKRISTGTRPKLYPDQWCFRVDEDMSQSPIFVVEYKAAHKLPANMIKDALASVEADGSLFHDVVREINSNKVSQDEAVKALVNSKRATAQVIVQAFHYMIEFGLEYCYVTSGEALLLLHIKGGDPQTLFYHLATPKVDVAAAQGEGEDNLRYTAVALVSTMVLLALESPALTQRWKQKTQTQLKKWPWAYATTELDRVVEESSQETQESQDDSCREPSRLRRRDNNDDDDTDYQAPPGAARRRGSNTPHVLLQSPRRTTRLASDKKRDCTSDNDGGHGAADDHGCDVYSNRTQLAAQKWLADRPAEYCTQACLRGLCNGSTLDLSCPNLRFHQRGDGTRSTHSISNTVFLSLMHRQLADDLDEDCDALDKYGKFGAIGALFRLTLRGYGYRVVAKGVQKPHLFRLWQEERVYNHLRAQQGKLVPVFLGIVHLEHEYWTSSGAHISDMMVLSYCGEPTGQRGLALPTDINKRILQLQTQLWKYGVQHGDERPANVVWNARLQRPMCIDFDWAEIVVAPGAVDDGSSEREKKRRRHDEDGGTYRRKNTRRPSCVTG